MKFAAYVCLILISMLSLHVSINKALRKEKNSSKIAKSNKKDDQTFDEDTPVQQENFSIDSTKLTVSEATPSEIKPNKQEELEQPKPQADVNADKITQEPNTNEQAKITEKGNEKNAENSKKQVDQVKESEEEKPEKPEGVNRKFKKSKSNKNKKQEDEDEDDVNTEESSANTRATNSTQAAQVGETSTNVTAVNDTTLLGQTAVKVNETKTLSSSFTQTQFIGLAALIALIL